MPRDSNNKHISKNTPNPKSNEIIDEWNNVNVQDENVFTLKAQPPQNNPKDSNSINSNQVNFKKNKKGCCLIF